MSNESFLYPFLPERNGLLGFWRSASAVRFGHLPWGDCDFKVIQKRELIGLRNELEVRDNRRTFLS